MKDEMLFLTSIFVLGGLVYFVIEGSCWPLILMLMVVVGLLHKAPVWLKVGGPPGPARPVFLPFHVAREEVVTAPKQHNLYPGGTPNLPF